MLKSIASFLLHCTYFFTFSIECPCQYYPQHQTPFIFTMLLFPRASEESFPKWRDGDQFFYINLEAATLSLLPILQYFYEILPGSHADRANKESVLQRSEAARCAPAIIAQWYTGSVPEGCVYAIYSHDTVFFSPWPLFCFSSHFLFYFAALFQRKFVLRDWRGETRPVDTASGKSKNPVTAAVSFSRNEQTCRNESVWCRPCATALGGNRIKDNLRICM